LPLPASTSLTSADSSPIAGSVLPIQRAEELLATLPGVISARIVSGPTGSVDEIHLLTTTDITPKQTVRNVESALIAHLGMRVSHKKISVAMSDDTRRPERKVPQDLHLSNVLHATPSTGVPGLPIGPSVLSPAPRPTPGPIEALNAHLNATLSGPPRPSPASKPVDVRPPLTIGTPAAGIGAVPAEAQGGRRRYQFEDVEVRRSRTKGLACRVTLRRGEQSYIGEADGSENDRLRTELAARATLAAIKKAEGEERVVALEGCKTIDAFERAFVFVGVVTRYGRESVLMTGSAEVRESPETASVLAVLDATNRWLESPGASAAK
jgi:hypothetical protein